MLGSVSEAEDVAQEALAAPDASRGPDRGSRPVAWMTTVATRLSINVLRSARASRKWCAGAMAARAAGSRTRRPGPASRAELAELAVAGHAGAVGAPDPGRAGGVSAARGVWLRVRARSPASSSETEANSRQLVTRARKHLEASRPRFDADEAARDAALLQAVLGGRRGRATWRPWRSCSPRTPSSTPTAAARCSRRPSRSSARRSSRASWPAWLRCAELRASSRPEW